MEAGDFFFTPSPPLSWRLLGAAKKPKKHESRGFRPRALVRTPHMTTNTITLLPSSSTSNLRKGLTLATVAAAEAVRPMTDAEYAAWHERTLRAYGPFDSAGESWIHSGVLCVSVPAGTVLEVVRARTSARVGWGNNRPGYAEVVNVSTGEHYRIPRAAFGV